MKNQFGSKIGSPRGQQKVHLNLGQVVPILEIDTTEQSKTEKGLRQLKMNKSKKCEYFQI